VQVPDVSRVTQPVWFMGLLWSTMPVNRVVFVELLASVHVIAVSSNGGDAGWN
jgi:hypothetical protein